MFSDMSGHTIRIRGVHEDEDVPTDAAYVIEGEDLGVASIMFLNDKTNRLVGGISENLPGSISAKYLDAARLLIAAFREEQNFYIKQLD